MTPQPKGFYLLFLVELCERYGFYTAVFLLVPYAVSRIGFSEVEASLLYGTYTALIYSTTFAGGIIADRLLGFRAATLIGLAIMASGSLLLATGVKAAAFVGLAALLVGNGYYKPSVSSLLGLLYEKDDPRRDSGYTLLYMGINIGAGGAALGAGLLSRDFGYHTAFLVAGLGKLLAFAALLAGGRVFHNLGAAPADRPLMRADFAGLPNLLWLAVGTIALVVLSNLLLFHAFAAGETIAVVCAAVFGFFLFAVLRLDAKSRQRALVMLMLFAFGVIFWAVYNQDADTILLFIAQGVDRTVMGFEIPSSSFLSLNSLVIIIGAPLMSILWFRLAGRDITPSESVRFAFGLLLLGAAYCSLALAPAGAGGLVSPLWLIVFFLLFSVAELLVEPIGLSMVSRLATRELMGFAMGMWFMTHALGNYGSGLLAKLAAVPEDTEPAGKVTTSQAAFLDYGLLALATGLLLIALLPVIARWRDATDDTKGDT
ncbi:MAG: oligopeptide:H+ symporter [Roseibium sp.]|uniref:peptide MFS transporter n=1 Tax=Roseibium sp. TaxID=1936156 RepID=UPI003D9C13D6